MTIDLEGSCERMLKVLYDVTEIVSCALQDPPESLGARWQHLSAAVGRIHQLTRTGWAKLTEEGPHGNP